MRTATPSRGSELLAGYLKRSGETQSDLARRIDACAPGLVGRWLRGDRRPSTPFAAKLFDVCGIPLAAWTKSPSASYLARLAA